MKRQALSALASVAKHSVDLAEMVVEAEVFPQVLIHLAHPDELVARSAAFVVREVTKHTLELCQLVVNTGGIGALIQLVSATKSETRLPGIINGGAREGSHDLGSRTQQTHSRSLLDVMFTGGDSPHTRTAHRNEDPMRAATIWALGHNKHTPETEDHVRAATIWALGHIGKHTPQHSRSLAEANIFPKMLQLYLSPESSEDLKQKCRQTLKLVLQKCINISALDPLLYEAPPDILKYIVGQFSKILPNDAKARRLFVTTGSLKRVQEIKAEPGSTLMEYITIINCCFPEDIIRYYSPGYPETLLDRVEQYQPELQDMALNEERRNSSEIPDLTLHLHDK
uniref:Sperm-associated antigen 6 n=1 Tax=Timema genevievae TaxID=629358 RepID=A0A7R9JRV8_TIMGE|nr:unnamed protein product [Timema genevievae]